MKTFKTFIEKPEFCNVPGGVKSAALAAKCAEPEKKKPAPQQADIRSKALTDTEKKKKQIRSLGLTHESEIAG
jgi:hypothetical protein